MGFVKTFLICFSVFCRCTSRVLKKTCVGVSKTGTPTSLKIGMPIEIGIPFF
jgi:hypothetical protein